MKHFCKIRNNLIHSLALLFFLAASLYAVGCSQGSGAGSNPTGQGNGGDSQTDPWKGVDTVGKLTSGQFNLLQVITIDKVNQTLTLTLPLDQNPLGGAASMNIPEVPGATVNVSQDPTSGSWTLNVVIPLKDITKGMTLPLGLTTLPNGDPLPGIASGDLPTASGHIKKDGFDFYLYGSPDYVAVFAPIKGFTPHVNLLLPVMNQDKTKLLGYAAIVDQKGTFDGGIYLTFNFPPELQAILAQLGQFQ